jgi:hypothetical protein
MSWSVERVGSALHVSIAMPMGAEWDALQDAIQANLEPKPLAIHIPSKISGATAEDARRLRAVWNSLGSAGIPLLPPV